MEIVKKAIEEKETEWKTKYNALEIKPGLKMVGGFPSDEPCIVFKVSKKEDVDPQKSIPSKINFVYDTKLYEILTDVIV